MSAKEVLKIQRNGIFYTPEPVARLLAQRAIDTSNIHVLDPSCGQGALLVAAAERCRELLSQSRPKFMGCDLFKPKGHPFDAKWEFNKGNYFKWNSNRKFDLVITNPPYIQYGRINEKFRKNLYFEYGQDIGLPRKIDMWVYFLIKATSHLKKDGSIAAIIPWSLLESDYSQSVRQWLSANFSDIEVLLLSHAHFEDTEKRIVLVWLKGFGKPAKSVKISFSDFVDDEHEFEYISLSSWCSNNVLAATASGASDVLGDLIDIGFQPLEEYANVLIGIVTGANKYFILPEAEAVAAGFTTCSTLPILTNSDELRGLSVRIVPPNRLLLFGRMTARRRKYISNGEKKGLCDRSHCKRRSDANQPWYKVNCGRIPDALFTYRVSEVPHLALNPKRVQCTNSIHKVFFKRLSMNERKWLQISLLSVFGQLCLESFARHFGNGVVKIEPKTLKKALVYTCKEPIPKEQYDLIAKLMDDNMKRAASALATKIIAQQAGLTIDIVNAAVDELNNLIIRRGGRVQFPYDSNMIRASENRTVIGQ